MATLGEYDWTPAEVRRRWIRRASRGLRVGSDGASVEGGLVEEGSVEVGGFGSSCVESI
jgi:hypothetical protein